MFSNFKEEDMSERSPLKGMKRKEEFVKVVKQSVRIKGIQPLVPVDQNKI